MNLHLRQRRYYFRFRYLRPAGFGVRFHWPRDKWDGNKRLGLVAGFWKELQLEDHDLPKLNALGFAIVGPWDPEGTYPKLLFVKRWEAKS